jgi:hypothetical protein
MKSIGSIVALAGIICIVNAASAAVIEYNYTLRPPSDGGGQPHDMYDLDHAKYYFWGMEWDVPSDQTIVGASLTFYNIWDWKIENDDSLKVDLIDSATDSRVAAKFGGTRSRAWRTYLGALGRHDNALLQGTDNQTTPRRCRRVGYRLENWNDPEGGRARDFNLVVPIPGTLFGWLSDGNFGFGIDPDCHYYNDRIGLTIRTEHRVPDAGSTATLLGLAIAGIGLIRRRLTA